MDGLLFSNHTPTPGLTEYKKAIEPVQVLECSTQTRIVIINRYDFLTLDHLKCECSMVTDGWSSCKREVPIPKGIKPGSTAALFLQELTLDELPANLQNPCYLEVSFTLKHSMLWAKAGHEVAFGQVPLHIRQISDDSKLANSGPCPKVMRIEPNILEVVGTNTRWQFDMSRGSLTSWRKSGIEILSQDAPMSMDFYRAVTDNERYNDGSDWIYRFLHQTSMHLQSFETSVDTSSNSVTIVALYRIAPPVLQWSVDTIMTYTMLENSLTIHVKGNPRGLLLPRTFARIGLTIKVIQPFTECSWFGRGPGESYSDSKLSQRFGNYSLPISELFTPYEFPQEGGNRTDVRWVEFSGKNTTTARASFGEQKGCSFSAGHYTTEDLDECEHLYDLEKRKKDELIIRLDWAHQGLGTGSCGPKVLPAYELPSKPFEFEVFLD